MNIYGPHFVYRAFDEFGLLLYVGCSKHVEKRIGQHRTYATWVQYLARVTSEEHPDRESALAAEAAAIEAERPYFNAQPEQTKLVHLNRVRARQAVDKVLKDAGIEHPGWDGTDEWWEAWYAAREAVQVLIAEKYPVVKDPERHAMYLAARVAVEAGAA